MSEKMIKVNVSCKQTMLFDQEIEVTEEEYKLLKEMDDDCAYMYGSNNDVFYILERCINFHDIISSDDEFTDISVNEVK